MLALITLLVSVAACLCVGSLVFARNPRNTINRLYTFVTICLVLYSIFNYLSLQTTQRLWYIRLVIFFTGLAISGIYYLVWSMYSSETRLGRWQQAGIVFTGIVALCDLTPIVFSGLSGQENPVPVPTPGVVLFLLQFVLFIIAAIVSLAKQMRFSEGRVHQQFMYLLLGIVPILFVAPVTGFVMPVLLDNASLVAVSPVYGAFFVFMVGYAIVRHRMFDIRIAVARSVAYAASVAVIIVLYVVLTFWGVNVAFRQHIAFGQGLTLAILTVLTALVFQPIKRRFDKLSNALFYRDAYDSQAFFNELNRALVSTISLDAMLTHASQVIARNLKSQSCVVLVREVGDKHRLVGTRQFGLSDTEMQTFQTLTAGFPKMVMVTDDLEPNRQQLKQMLIDRGVAVIVKMAPTPLDRGLGYIILGSKKSGNPYGTQDIKILESVANVLIIAIQNALHYEEIQQFNKVLQARVDEATRKFRRTNEKLRQLDETKDDFISMASHQLRTPLTSIKGYLSMVLEGDAGKLNAQQTQMLTQSYASAQRMVYLISDLLNLSRLNTGKFVIDAAPTDLAEAVQTEVDQLVETAKAREVALVYHRPPEFPLLMLDETKIHQVVMNFLDNAIYYTPAGGHITVTLTETPTAIEYRVQDDGIGVPKRERAHLFTKFYRAGNARKARPDGTGLGLFMAKKVVLAQGGSIIFESEEGKGSTFGFRFNKADHSVPSTDGTGTTP